MTKKICFKTFSLIFALFVAIYATGAVFAWFTMQNRDMDISGYSAGAYFAYGDGTKTKLKKKDKDGNVEEWIEGQDDKDDWDRSTGPFGINDPRHMFNLAWLNNIGRFKDKQYYFEIEKDKTIDMRVNGKNVVLPPIGNYDYPFKGVFDGNGGTIKNLIISTNKSVLYGNFTIPSYKFSNAVGLFGMTAGTKDNEAEIKNFILDYPTVEVANKNDYISLQDERNKNNDQKLGYSVGIAVGYIADNVKVQSIGIKGGSLAVRKTDYQTYNSILGQLSPNAQLGNIVTGSGQGAGGSGNMFGADFDSRGIWERFEEIAKNYDENGNLLPDASFRLPNIVFRGNDDFSLAPLEKMPFTITSESTYEGPNAKEVVSPKNIGYLLGGENEIFSDEVTFSEKLVKNGYFYYTPGTNGQYVNKGNPWTTNTIPRWFYWTYGNYVNTNGEEGSYAENTLIPFEQDEMIQLAKDSPDIMSIIGYKLDENEKLVSTFTSDEDGIVTTVFDSILLGGEFTDKLQVNAGGNHNSGNIWTPHGMIEWGEDKDDKTKAGQYGTAYERDGYAADEDGYFYDGDDSSGNGYELSGYLMEDDLRRFQYDDNGNKVYTGDTGKKVPIDRYMGGIALPDNGIWFRPANVGKIRLIIYSDQQQGGISLIKLQRPAAYATKENIFGINWAKGRWGGDGDTGDITFTETIYTFPPNVLFCFLFDVKQPDLDAGYEYWMLPRTSYNPVKFVFMDIGASGSKDDGTQTGPSVDTVIVKYIDFIYNNVSIEQTETNSNGVPKGGFITEGDRKEYIETGVRLTFNGDGEIVTFYYRQPSQEKDKNPTIYASYKATSNKLISKNGDTQESIKAKITGDGWNFDVNGDLTNNNWTLPLT